jgi:hypothetical protein
MLPPRINIYVWDSLKVQANYICDGSLILSRVHLFVEIEYYSKESNV